MRLKNIARMGALTAALFLAWAPDGARAMSVSPTHIELKSAGSESRAQVIVRNDSSAPLPVEASLQKLVVDAKGKSHATAESNDFLVFPPQTLIPPGASQVFRITWVGEPLLDASQSYQLTLSQIPVRLAQPTNRVQVVMAFGVVINVAPPRGQAQLDLVGTSITKNAKGERNPVITVRNPSRVHALLPQSTIRLAGDGWSQTLTPAFLDQRVGIGLVQPGKERRFVLPVAVPAGVRQVRASLDFKPGRN
ncbi:MAG: molecular chaperone [Hyphomicrobiaceae bacterium]